MDTLRSNLWWLLIFSAFKAKSRRRSEYVTKANLIALLKGFAFILKTISFGCFQHTKSAEKMTVKEKFSTELFDRISCVNKDLCKRELALGWVDRMFIFDSRRLILIETMSAIVFGALSNRYLLCAIDT